METLSSGKTDCYSVSFHPDGQHLVSGGYDKVVRLYDAARGGAAIKTFEGHHALVSRAVFSPHVRLRSVISHEPHSFIPAFFDRGTLPCWRVGQISDNRFQGCDAEDMGFNIRSLYTDT